MKKSVFLPLACVIFLMLACAVKDVYASDFEHFEFFYLNREFNYYLADNIKENSQFDLDFKLNAYHRFRSSEDRRELLENMLSIGFDKQVALSYIFPNLNDTIEKIALNIYQKPQDASIKINSNTENVFKIKDEIKGVKLDKSALYDDICEKFLNQKPLKFSVPTITTAPKITRRDYEKNTHLRADFSTDISHSSEDRKHNVKTALNSLNKLEIAPNETFSFNKIVGRRTEENGYRTAKIIINNEYVDGVGGGVCQVSSTLYNSALLAGLKIVEANRHSKQIGYVKYGFDAMVNYGSSDLKIKNNTNEKITFITNFSPTNARIRIFGADLDDVSYKLSNEIVSITEPEEEIQFDEKGEYLDKVVYEDEYFVFNTGVRGMEVKSYREKYVGGAFVSRELLRFDKFKVENKIKIFGTKKRTDTSYAQNEKVESEADFSLNPNQQKSQN